MTKKKLVIVESPSKATTIKKYLGSGYNVVASMGHIIDLPKSQIGIDLDGDFEPRDITSRGSTVLHGGAGSSLPVLPASLWVCASPS